VDSSKNLVDLYATTASTLSVHLSAIVPEITKIFNALPLKVNKFTN
jgi:hypothetical protein